VKVANETANSLGDARVIDAERLGYNEFKNQLGFKGSDILEYNFFRKLRTDNVTSGLQVFITPSNGISITSN
jgi:hypothetical protein